MADREGRLVRVSSESELRPGMLVVVRPCFECDGRDHRMMLLGRAVVIAMCVLCDSGRCAGWRVSNNHPDCDGLSWCLASHIERGRLFRVDLGDLTERETETERERERVE